MLRIHTYTNPRWVGTPGSQYKRIYLCPLFATLWTLSALAQSTVLDSPLNENAHSLVNAAEKQEWSTFEKLLTKIDADVSASQPDGMTALHWAAHWSRTDSVKKLLERKAPVNAVNRYGLSPLSLACENGDLAIARMLIRAGADTEIVLPGDQSLLMTAARSGSKDLVHLLVESGVNVQKQDKVGQTALMWAAAEGHAQIVSTLLSHGANPNEQSKNGFTAMFFACRDGHWPVAAELLKAGVDINAIINVDRKFERAPRNGMSALLFAVESAHYELAIRLTESGADPNDQRSGLTPLHSLCWVRRTKIGDNPEGDPPPRGSGNITSLQFVREMVQRGADINRRLERGEGGKAQLKPRGSTPFLYAARTADLPLLKAMLECGADPNLGNADDCKPIQATAGVGVTAVGEEPGSVAEVQDVLTFLIGLGADVNAVDRNGETAMHGAAYRNYPETVTFLAERGANPTIWNQKNKYGWTPTMIAQGNRPGSFKPSPETIAAIEAAIRSASPSTSTQP